MAKRSLYFAARKQLAFKIAEQVPCNLESTACQPRSPRPYHNYLAWSLELGAWSLDSASTAS